MLTFYNNTHILPTLPPSLFPGDRKSVLHFYNIISRMIFKWNHGAYNLSALTFFIQYNSQVAVCINTLLFFIAEW